jgi:hypothetical protein
MSFDRGGESQGPDAGGVAIEGHYVVPPCSAILKDEDFTPAFGAQVEQLVPGAAQEAGEIEIARLERDLPRRHRGSGLSS